MVSQQTSVISAAKAVYDHINLWLNGTEDDDWTSFGVITEKNDYNIPEGICYSMPVKCKNFDYLVVGGLPLTELVKKKMQISLQDLLNEEMQAFQENDC